MNLPVLVLLSMIITFGGSILSTQLVMTTAMHRLLAADVATQAEESAQLSLLTQLQAIVRYNVQHGLDPGSSIGGNDAGLPTQAVQIGSTTYYMRYETSVNPGGSSPCTGNGTSQSSGTNDVAPNVQCANYVKEQRFSATLRVKLLDRDQQDTLATKTRFLTFRVFRAAPYVLVDGTRENEMLVSSNATGDSGGEGDGGGVPASSGGTDTTIRAHSGCSDANGNNDGTSWGGNNRDGVSQICENPYPASTQGDVGATPSPSWSNGNSNGAGWTR